ncbi:hypothetical protein AC578_5043 [Pseudocercospora eumusae]|uniref:Uncharacterized protein n=1 Tax=Pseudocercospora eumusae TaxID=321146 RepID=A0A139H619_9PEZI|nr:hypothetical protein AC578_5043 [Pseudocercospora eumusae]
MARDQSGRRGMGNAIRRRSVPSRRAKTLSRQPKKAYNNLAPTCNCGFLASTAQWKGRITEKVL